MNSENLSLLDQVIAGINHDFHIDTDNSFQLSTHRYSLPPTFPELDLLYDIYVGKNVFFLSNSLNFVHQLFSLDTVFIVDKTAYDSVLEFFETKIPPKKVFYCDDLSSKSQLDSLISLVADHSFFVALGSGFLQDICKFIQHVTSVQCLMIPTALSTHVFASNFIHAHNILREYGLKKSLKSHCTFISLLFGDFLEMTHKRFPRLLKSGLADVYALRTATIEWQYGPQYLGSNVHKFAVLLSDKAISLLLSFSKTQMILDVVLAQVLLNVITDVVGSPPASGTEHLYANTIEKYHNSSDFHGELVAKGILLQLSIADIFSEHIILDEMSLLGILPKQSLSYIDLDKSFISKMIDLSIVKNRFTILSVVN